MRKVVVTLVGLLLVASIGACGGSGGDDDAPPGVAAGEEPAAASGDRDDGEDSGAAPDAGAGPGAPEQAIRDYLRATAIGDGEAACALLSAEGRRSFERALAQGGGDETCEELVEAIATYTDEPVVVVASKEVALEEIDALDFRVERSGDGRTAKVTAVGEREPTEVELVDGRWRISDMR